MLGLKYLSFSRPSSPSQTRPSKMPNTSENNSNELPADKDMVGVQHEELHSVDDDAPPTLTAEEEKRLWRKVDRRLMPMLSVMYLLSFTDRGALDNFSKVETNASSLLFDRQYRYVYSSLVALGSVLSDSL